MKKFFITIMLLAAGLLATNNVVSAANHEPGTKASTAITKTDDATIEITQLGCELTVDISTGDGYVDIYNASNQLVWSGSITSGGTINMTGVTGFTPGNFRAKCDPRHGKYLIYLDFTIVPF